MTDVLKQLSRASWREIEFPIIARDYAFAQQQSKHKYLFRDNEMIESLGAESPAYRYTIPFREDIQKGPYRNLFVATYPKFLEACKNRDEGILEDPVHGPIQVKCTSLRELLDVYKKDGIDVEVEFVVAPDQDDVGQDLGTVIQTLDGAKDASLFFNQQSAAIEWHQEVPPAVEMSIFDTISSVTDRIYAAQNKIGANLADVSFRMEKATASIDRLKNPKLAPLRQQARRLMMAAIDLHDELLKPPNPVAVYETVAEIGVITAAGLLHMATTDLLRLNPSLTGKLRVPRGTRLRYFRKAA